MRVLIAGCGYVGTALAQALASEGHRVWGLSRRPRGLPEAVEPLAADLTDPSSLASLPPGLDAVVYAASAGGFEDTRYRAAYVDGVSCLLAALYAQGQRPGRVLFTSSTGVYHQRAGEWVDETSPADSRHFSGRRVREGEELVLRGPFPATVLRLGGIYGPGRAMLVDKVRRGEIGLASGPPVYSNRIHRDDAAAALAHLLRLPEPEPLYLGVDNEPAAMNDIVRWLAGTLGVEVAAEAEEPVAPGPMSPRGNKRCSNSKLRDSGYRFRFPTFREGFTALL